MYKDRKACEYVLRIIMDDEELTVIDNEVQMDFKNMPDRPYNRTIKANIETVRGWLAGRTPAKK